jgi:hypothetical protein
MADDSGGSVPGIVGRENAGITTGLVIAGEITFYLGIFLVGKEFLVKIKNKFKRKKDVPPEIDPVD